MPKNRENQRQCEVWGDNASAICGSGVPPIAVSVADAAKLISLSRSTIYELIKAGHLGTIRIGGRRLIPYRSLEVLLTRGRDGVA